MPHLIILEKVRILQGQNVTGTGVLQDIVAESERLHDWLHANENNQTPAAKHKRGIIEAWFENTETCLDAMIGDAETAKTAAQAITT